MTYISSQSIQSSIRQSVLQAQAGLAQAQTEAASGTQTDIGVFLGAATGKSVSIKNEIDGLQGYTATNVVASTRLDTTATTLTSMVSAAQAISASLVTASSTGASIAGLQTIGQSTLQALLAGLNTSVNGQYAFGGINSGVEPATTYAATSSAKQSVDTAFSSTFGFSQTSANAATISGSAMTSFLNGSFDEQFSAANWSANWSKASDTTISSKIAPSQSTTTSVSANADAFRQIAEAYTMLGEFTGSNMSADAQAAVVSKATTLVNSGLAALNAVQTGVGTSQAAITAANTGLSAQTTVLTNQVSDMTSVDPLALSTRVTSLQNQLQASYELTSRLQSLSLTNYITG